MAETHFIHNKLVFIYYTQANLNKWVLRTFPNISLLAASLIWFGNLVACSKGFLSAHCCMAFCILKSELIGAFSPLYTIGSDRLHTTMMMMMMLIDVLRPPLCTR